MDGLEINDDLESTEKEGLRETTINLDQDFWCPIFEQDTSRMEFKDVTSTPTRALV
jgi:hypothetical protein